MELDGVHQHPGVARHVRQPHVHVARAVVPLAKAPVGHLHHVDRDRVDIGEVRMVGELHQRNATAVGMTQYQVYAQGRGVLPPVLYRQGATGGDCVVDDGIRTGPAQQAMRVDEAHEHGHLAFHPLHEPFYRRCVWEDVLVPKVRSVGDMDEIHSVPVGGVEVQGHIEVVRVGAGLEYPHGPDGNGGIKEMGEGGHVGRPTGVRHAHLDGVLVLGKWDGGAPLSEARGVGPFPTCVPHLHSGHGVVVLDIQPGDLDVGAYVADLGQGALDTELQEPPPDGLVGYAVGHWHPPGPCLVVGRAPPLHQDL